MSGRDAFLARVRKAVADGNQAGAAAPHPGRSPAGYQGAGTDPARRFCDELAAAGGKPHLANDAETAWRVVQDVVRSQPARKVVLNRNPLIDRLDLVRRLRQTGVEVILSENLPAAADNRDAFFGADLGISGVYRLVAETGSVVLSSAPQEPRSVSLLPPVHIALADMSQLLPDLFDLFDLFSPVVAPGHLPPPSCLTLITGPSKTGDIELRLVTGVHGPGEIHVVLCTF